MELLALLLLGAAIGASPLAIYALSHLLTGKD